jgi:hypothetical protein
LSADSVLAFGDPNSKLQTIILDLLSELGIDEDFLNMIASIAVNERITRVRRFRTKLWRILRA